MSSFSAYLYLKSSLTHLCLLETQVEQSAGAGLGPDQLVSKTQEQAPDVTAMPDALPSQVENSQVTAVDLEPESPMTHEASPGATRPRVMPPVCSYDIQS